MSSVLCTRAQVDQSPAPHRSLQDRAWGGCSHPHLGHRPQKDKNHPLLACVLVQTSVLYQLLCLREYIAVSVTIHWCGLTVFNVSPYYTSQYVINVCNDREAWQRLQVFSRSLSVCFTMTDHQPRGVTGVPGLALRQLRLAWLACGWGCAAGPRPVPPWLCDPRVLPPASSGPPALQTGRWGAATPRCGRVWLQCRRRPLGVSVLPESAVLPSEPPASPSRSASLPSGYL